MNWRERLDKGFTLCERHHGENYKHMSKEGHYSLPLQANLVPSFTSNFTLPPPSSRAGKGPEGNTHVSKDPLPIIYQSPLASSKETLPKGILAHYDKMNGGQNLQSGAQVDSGPQGPGHSGTPILRISASIVKSIE